MRQATSHHPPLESEEDIVQSLDALARLGGVRQGTALSVFVGDGALSGSKFHLAIFERSTGLTIGHQVRRLPQRQCTNTKPARRGSVLR